MAKLTRKQTNALIRVLANLDRAHQYLNDDRTVVTRTKSTVTTTQDLANQAGLITCPINKEYGSNLTGYGEGIRLMRQFIVDNS